LLVCCSACSPARPISVPEGAQYISKGSASWHYCATNGRLEESAFYQCTYYDSYGRSLRSGWYVSIAVSDQVEEYPKVKSALEKWRRVDWWKENKLLLVFGSQSHEYHGSVSGKSYSYESQIYFADKDCISLLGAQDYKSLERRLEIISEDTGISRIHPEFKDLYKEYTSALRSPLRRDRESPCLVHYYFLS
jgi:hypothetical protein